MVPWASSLIPIDMSMLEVEELFAFHVVEEVVFNDEELDVDWLVLEGEVSPILKLVWSSKEIIPSKTMMRKREQIKFFFGANFDI